MPFTEDDERKMGEIADAAAIDAMTKLAGMLGNSEFQLKLLSYEMVAPPGNPEFDRQQLDDAISHLEFVLDVAKSRQARLLSARGEKVETNG